MTGIPEAFETLLKESVGAGCAQTVLQALDAPASVSIRLNPAKLRSCPFPGATPIPWSPYGFLLQDRPVFTLDPLFHAGCYYVQDSSAMAVGHIARQFMNAPHMAVLDLCAAPGGKTTDLAASLRERWGDRFSLLANEVMRSRYAILRSNVQTWADNRVGTLHLDPSAFGSAPVFDLIVADVPCSGEGMFRKDAQAVAEWSPETVAFCAARSKRILADIWPALKCGGVLVYSTCTFNHFENDDTVEWAARELGAQVVTPEMPEPALRTRCGWLMLPGLVPGEGQYVAALRKDGPPDSQLAANLFRLFGAQVSEDSQVPGGRGSSRSIGPLFSDGRSTSAGDPASINVDRATALRYLHGDAIVLPEGTPLGPLTICYEGHALGPAKNLGKRCNNLYPKSKRIRMDIP